MKRSLLGTLAGVLLSFAIVAVLEPVGHALFDLPKLPAMPSAADRVRYMDGVTLAPKLWLIGVWFVAPFAGGAIAAQIGRQKWPSAIVAMLFLAAIMSIFVQYAHPAWMIASAVVLISIAPALANRVALRGR